MDIQTEIQKVKKLSRVLRGICTVSIVMLVLFSTLLLFMSFFSRAFILGAFKIRPDQWTLSIALYAIVLLGFVLVVAFVGLAQLRSLFDNLSGGEIYSIDNVAHLRNLGWLTFAGAMVHLLLPLVEVAAYFAGIFEKTMMDPQSTAAELSNGMIGLGLPLKALTYFVLAGLLILAAWIMEMGRLTKEETQRLQSESELVV